MRGQRQRLGLLAEIARANGGWLLTNFWRGGVFLVNVPVGVDRLGGLSSGGLETQPCARRHRPQLPDPGLA